MGVLGGRGTQARPGTLSGLGARAPACRPTCPVLNQPYCRPPRLQTVLEGDLVNLGVTSPAAALALGLMYLQTNDAAVAAAFHLPGAHKGALSAGVWRSSAGVCA